MFLHDVQATGGPQPSKPVPTRPQGYTAVDCEAITPLPCTSVACRCSRENPRDAEVLTARAQEVQLAHGYVVCHTVVTNKKLAKPHPAFLLTAPPRPNRQSDDLVTFFLVQNPPHFFFYLNVQGVLAWLVWFFVRPKLLPCAIHALCISEP